MNSLFLMYLTNGIVMGVIYALSALGVSLIVGIMNVINFAHGELYIFAGYISYILSVKVGLSFYFAIPIAILTIFILGILIERSLIKPTYGNDMYSLIITFILSIVLQNFALLVFGPFPNKPPNWISGATNMFGLFRYGNQRLVSCLVAIGIIVIVFLLIKKTWFGKTIRAVSQDRETASLMGIDTSKVNMLSFGLGCAIAGAAGVVLTPIFPVTPLAGVEISLIAFVILVIGGMGSLYGCIIGGLIIGIVQSLGAGYISSGYKDIFGFIILILVLVIRPAGLFGRKAL
jgi:branched-chain amino acid transport system permease protein